MQRGIGAGTIQTVVVWKLDRLSRRQREGINLLADWCERGVRVVAVTQHIGHSLVRVLNLGGLVWESRKTYASINDALAEADQAVAAELTTY